MGSSVNAGEITLRWTSDDIDNDILGYKIYLDMADVPVSVLEETSNTSSNITLGTATNYYWKVETIDAVGNISTSQVFQFKTN